MNGSDAGFSSAAIPASWIAWKAPESTLSLIVAQSFDHLSIPQTQPMRQPVMLYV